MRAGADLLRGIADHAPPFWTTAFQLEPPTASWRTKGSCPQPGPPLASLAWRSPPRCSTTEPGGRRCGPARGFRRRCHDRGRPHRSVVRGHAVGPGLRRDLLARLRRGHRHRVPLNAARSAEAATWVLDDAGGRSSTTPSASESGQAILASASERNIRTGCPITPGTWGTPPVSSALGACSRER